jgi:rhodanese-related sulfurtransferase
VSVPIVDPATAQRWVEAGQAILIDVREPFEHSSAHIACAKLLPLTTFKAEQVAPSPGKKIIVHCKGGTRSQQAAAMLLGAGRSEVYSLAGGILAWKAAGLPLAGSGRSVIDAQRQVFIMVACMILTGLWLGISVSRWWFILPTLAGLGLLNAGLTGFCPLLLLVAKAPWNRGHSKCPAA